MLLIQLLQMPIDIREQMNSVVWLFLHLVQISVQ